MWKVEKTWKDLLLAPSKGWRCVLPWVRFEAFSPGSLALKPIQQKCLLFLDQPLSNCFKGFLKCCFCLCEIHIDWRNPCINYREGFFYTNQWLPWIWINTCSLLERWRKSWNDKQSNEAMILNGLISSECPRYDRGAGRVHTVKLPNPFENFIIYEAFCLCRPIPALLSRFREKQPK